MRYLRDLISSLYLSQYVQLRRSQTFVSNDFFYILSPIQILTDLWDVMESSVVLSSFSAFDFRFIFDFFFTFSSSTPEHTYLNQTSTIYQNIQSSFTCQLENHNLISHTDKLKCQQEYHLPQSYMNMSGKQNFFQGNGKHRVQRMTMIMP